MPKSGDELKDLLLLYRNIEHQYKLQDYTDNQLKSIQKSLNSAKKDLLTKIDKLDLRIPEGMEHDRLKELNKMTFGIQSKLTGDIKQAAIMAGENSYREYGNILSFNGKLNETVGFNNVALSASQLSAMVNQPVGGKILEKWVSDSFSSRIVDGIQTMILAENLKGVSTQGIIRKISGAFDLVKRDAETIARTHIASANNKAAMDVYKANSDVVNSVEWSATLEVAMDGRGTCMQCAALDSRVWGIDESHPIPPIHPRCRCFMLPKTKGYKKLGLDIDEMKKGLRPFTERDKNRNTIEAGRMSGSFEDFLKTRGVKYQKDLLGPSRYKMWEAGKIKIEDLVDKNGKIRLLYKNRKGLLGKSGARTVVKPTHKIKITEHKGVSKEFRSKVDNIINNIPDNVKKSLEESGLHIEVSRLLTDARPELSGIRPRGWPKGTTWNSVEGVYNEKLNYVVTSEKVKYFGKLTDARPPERVLPHELGHAFDSSVGQKIKGSSSDAFIEAYKKDSYKVSLKREKELSYFFQPGAAGREETFAEIFNEQIGFGIGHFVSKDFPEVTKYIKKLLGK